ncbi:hypothetical protein [Rivibacter subsaxonicus]|uniref:Uncharacterized protein n=1 Tax=Rivibacter subsaxonicus TaxID=457575 RepID=A0A4Q7VWS9_9BURK|nr:hypothetical protein [Rivibacter subsaxonicus]RZU01212.1 hypothetical protein EV670_1928 [Rivibacter subsaxonicus]
MNFRFAWMRWRRRALSAVAARLEWPQALRRRPAPPPPLRELKTLCVELVNDLPTDQRLDLVTRIGGSREARDLWFMRSCFFRAVSLHFGEHEARRRMARLDVWLQA